MDDWTTSRTGRVRHNDVLRASQVGRGMNDALMNDPHSHECIREMSVIGVKERQKRRFIQGSISICSLTCRIKKQTWYNQKWKGLHIGE
jgi:hypothetical protein